MNTKRIKALFKREITDIFRDKKTLFMMVAIPLLLYPLMIVVITLIMNMAASNQAKTVYQVSFVEIEPEIKEAVLDIISDEENELVYQVEAVESKDPKKDLDAEKIHCYVTVKTVDGIREFELHYLSALEDSRTAANTLKEALEIYREDLREQGLEEIGVDPQKYLYPVTYELADQSSNEESMGNVMGSVVPMLIIFSIIFGAMYPAIDVTAGERERGTLETLLTLPVTNFEMIMSKFFAVALVACMSALLNILSLGVAVMFMVVFMADSLQGFELHLSSFVPAILITVVVMLVFALFVSAICLCTSVFAKSFKEANNYNTPIMLIFMFGGYAGMIPDLELTKITATMPIINVTLMIEQLFNLKYDYPLFGVVLLTNIAYSLLAIWVLGRIYNSEAVLFGEGFQNIKIITKRSEMKQGQMPGVGDVILLCCVTLLLMFYVGTLATLKLGFPGVAVQQGIILCLPLFYAWYLKCDRKKLFTIRKISIRNIIATIAVWIGGYSLLCLLSGILSSFLSESAMAVEETFAEFTRQPFWVLFLVIAIMPAIGEELMFRGFLFGTLKTKVRVVPAMLITSAIFGIYHMSLIKFFTTALLGLLLALVVEKSGSLFAGMLLHLMNNGFSVVLMKYPKVVETYLPLLGKETYQPVEYLVLIGVGVVFLGVGLWIMKKDLQLK